MSERMDKIIDFFAEAGRRGKKLSMGDGKITQRATGEKNRQEVNMNQIRGASEKRRTVSQTAKGDGNVQQVIITQTPPTVRYLPPLNSIGSDLFLKQRIQTLFHMIGEAREKRFGKSAYPAMYRKFKSDFNIKKQPWTIIWTWPKGCASSIIEYLEAKYANTIEGKIERAANREGFFPTRPRLYEKEAILLKHFGLKLDSPEVRIKLNEYFGTRSHKNLTHLQHWQWVKYLEGEVEKLED